MGRLAVHDDSRWTDGRRPRASMREVAELANVAISSVSRVLSGHPDVSADMRERVLEAVRQLEYEPDFLAQSLRRGATLSVGWVIGDI
jgi:LacI family transcriptional regulator